MRQIAPQHERHRFEIYGRVAETGEPVRFVNEARELGRWYDVYAALSDPPEQHRLAVVFNDITARRQGEDALRSMAADEVVYHFKSPDYVRHMDAQEQILLQIYRSFQREGIQFAHPLSVVRVAGAHDPVGGWPPVGSSPGASLRH